MIKLERLVDDFIGQRKIKFHVGLWEIVSKSKENNQQFIDCQNNS